MSRNEKSDDLIIDLTARPGGIVRIEFARATMDCIKECFMCHKLTPRALTHKVSHDIVWEVKPWCDWCFEGVQLMPHNNPNIMS